MSEPNESVPRSDLASLAARVRELEAQIIRMTVVVRPGDVAAPGTDACTNCHTGDCTKCGTGHCTNCAGDLLDNILLPGELERLSGRELVKRLQPSRQPGK
jgi:hypothetical protein